MQKDPYLDDRICKYITNTARKNLWKVANWYALDDLIQDGYMCYARVRARYVKINPKREPGTTWELQDCDNPSKADRKRLMARLQLAFDRHIITLANKHTPTHTNREKVGELAVSQIRLANRDEDEDQTTAVWEKIGGGTQPAGELLALLSSAPKEIKALIEFLMDDHQKALEYLQGVGRKRIVCAPHGGVTALIGKGGRLNRQILAKIVGVEPGEDLQSVLRNYFYG